MIGKAIFDRLSTAAPVAALVGDRISPDVIDPSETRYPRIAYDADTLNRERSYAGSAGLSSKLVTVACVATTRSEAAELAKRVNAALDNQEGTWGGIVVKGCFLESDREDTASSADTGQEGLLYLTELDYLIWYRE